MCLNCLKICPVKALKYKKADYNSAVNHGFNNVINRRNLIFSGSSTAAVIILYFLTPVKLLNKIFAGETQVEKLPVPPGSISVEHLRERCSSCHLCISVCPTNIIVPSPTVLHSEGIFQPVLDYKNGYCTYECIRCSSVCPTGAISPLSVENKKKISIGKSELDIHKCIVTLQGIDCGACAEHCPTGAVYMEKKGNLYYPVTDETKCVGCGACAHVCPAEPVAFSIAARGVHTVLTGLPAEGKEFQDEKKGFSF